MAGVSSAGRPTESAVVGDREEALAHRKRHWGLIGVRSKIPLKDKSILDLVSAAGVAETCSDIFKDPLKSYDYSCRGNTVAVVSDGSRVLGLGGIGPEAALPVLEGKAVILKTFAGVDAFPLCLGSADVFVGTSVGGAVTAEMVRSMARDAIVFALANPSPEISPQEARNINDAMKIAAATAIAGSVAVEELRPECVLPNGMSYAVAPRVAAAVARSAIETGEARVPLDPTVIEENTKRFVYEGRLYPYEGNGA